MLIYYAITGISAILGRIMDLAISVSAIFIALLWIPIAINFFSTDEEKRYTAKERLKNAAIGTAIYIMAITGVIYSVFNYIITGKI